MMNISSELNHKDSIVEETLSVVDVVVVVPADDLKKSKLHQ